MPGLAAGYFLFRNKNFLLYENIFKEDVRMANILSETILRNWDGINVIANIDEKLEDIMVAVKYSDHGDDFLFVKTMDGKMYEYGWYIGRRDVLCPDYYELIESPNNWGFIRKPELFCAYDERCVLGNEIYWYVADRFYDRITMRTIKYDPFTAQWKFDDFVRFMNKIYERRITYHKEDYEKIIRDYLTVNEILTQENLEKLHSVKFTSGENGIDGSAGKKERHVYKVLEGDRVEFVWYNGEFRKFNSKQVKYYYDREYFERFKLYLGQFK